MANFASYLLSEVKALPLSPPSILHLPLLLCHVCLHLDTCPVSFKVMFSIYLCHLFHLPRHPGWLFPQCLLLRMSHMSHHTIIYFYADYHIQKQSGIFHKLSSVAHSLSVGHGMCCFVIGFILSWGELLRWPWYLGVLQQKRLQQTCQTLAAWRLPALWETHRFSSWYHRHCFVPCHLQCVRNNFSPAERILERLPGVPGRLEGSAFNTG